VKINSILPTENHILPSGVGGECNTSPMSPLRLVPVPIRLFHFLHLKKLTGRRSFRLRHITVPLNLKIQKLDPLLMKQLEFWAYQLQITSELKTSSISKCDLTNTHIVENISHDPGTYCDDILTEKKHDIWIRKGPEFFWKKNSNFLESLTSFSDVSGKIKTRSLTRNVFTSELTNGEWVERSCLIYLFAV